MPASSSSYTAFSPFPWSIPQRRLLGVIDVELYTDELHELGEEKETPGDELFQLIGVHLARAVIRPPWLGAGPSPLPVAPGVTFPAALSPRWFAGCSRSSSKPRRSTCAVYSRCAGVGGKREHPVGKSRRTGPARRERVPGG